MIERGAERRLLLRRLAAASLLPMWGCGGGGDDDSTSTGSTTTGGSTSSGSCTVIPSETAGPYPGDGTNTNSSGVVNVLTLSGIVRSDIRSSFGAPRAPPPACR